MARTAEIDTLDQAPAATAAAPSRGSARAEAQEVAFPSVAVAKLLIVGAAALLVQGATTRTSFDVYFAVAMAALFAATLIFGLGRRSRNAAADHTSER